MQEDFRKFDLVFFDSKPNDEKLSSHIGTEQYLTRVIYEICSTIASQTRLIILGFCLDRFLEAESQVYSSRQIIGQICGAQFVSMRELVLQFGPNFIEHGESLYEDEAHPQQRIARAAGYCIGKSLRDIGQLPFPAADNTCFKDHFAHFDPTCLRHTGTISSRRNSLFEVDFLALRAGESVSIPRI
jgi:hypothetical protein